MSRLVVAATLLPGAEAKAAALLEQGPPFNPATVGLLRHFAFLSEREVIFVFEGPAVEWTVDDLVNHPVVAAALEPWRRLAEHPPRVAREVYAWERAEAGVPAP